MTTSSPVFLVGNEIAFSTCLLKGNDLFYDIEVEQLYTPYGFVVPLDNQSIDIIDYLEHGADNICIYDRVAKSLLVTHTGALYEVTMAHTNVMKDDFTLIVARLRVLTGPGTVYARSCESKLEERAMMCLHLKKTCRKAHELYSKTYELSTVKYVFMDIEKIAQTLRDKQYTKPFPKPVNTPPVEQ